ncbi:hypothetical protein Nmel_007554, partial [Mimus melanotis]
LNRSPGTAAPGLRSSASTAGAGGVDSPSLDGNAGGQLPKDGFVKTLQATKFQGNACRAKAGSRLRPESLWASKI